MLATEARNRAKIGAEAVKKVLRKVAHRRPFDLVQEKVVFSARLVFRF
jgi:hypothetical protein